MTAPELSPAERATVDRFDNAPDLPEAWHGENTPTVATSVPTSDETPPAGTRTPPHDAERHTKA